MDAIFSRQVFRPDSDTLVIVVPDTLTATVKMVNRVDGHFPCVCP